VETIKLGPYVTYDDIKLSIKKAKFISQELKKKES
jgi:hypothetical protein